MENMIKVRAMRAAGIACFLVLAIIGAWISTTPSGDVVERAYSSRKNGGRRCHLRDLYARSLSTCCRVHCLSFLEMGD